MNRPVELNCDLGELSLAHDLQLLPYFDACNISCGAHAGTPDQICETIDAALDARLAVGCHPSYPDRQNFGRLSMASSFDSLIPCLVDQIASFAQQVDQRGGTLRHIKPHGALYHDVCHDPQRASQWIELCQRAAPEAQLLAMAGCVLSQLCNQRRIPVLNEAFGDRNYEDSVRLVQRTHARALIDDAASLSAHLQRLRCGHVVDVHKRCHPLPIDSICLHSDSAHALEFAKLARQMVRRPGQADTNR